MQHIKSGVDLVSATCLTKSLVQQAIDTAYPYPKQGFLIYSPTAPDVVADPLLAYFWWVKTDVSYVPLVPFEPYYYSGSSWTALPLLDGSRIAPGTIPLTALSMSGSTAFYIIRANSTNNALEWVSIVNALVNNTIPPAKLLAPDSVYDYVLTCIAGVKAFMKPVDLFALLDPNIFPIASLIKGGANTLGLFLQTDPAGGNIRWINVDVANLAAAGYTAGQSLRRNAGNTAWEGYTPTGFTFITPQTIYATAGAIDWTTANLTPLGVPATATMAVLQLEMVGGTLGGGSTGACLVNGRKDSGSSTLILGQVNSTAGDGTEVDCQAFVPLTVDQKFDYKVSITTTGSAQIKLIGYF